MAYEYGAPYNYLQIGSAQPHTDPYFVSPDSPAMRLGLNQEQIRELLKEQEQLDREFQMELEEEERARVSAQHQRQEHHQDETRWVPTPPISNFDPTPQTYEVPDKPPKGTASQYDDGPLDPELAPHLLHQLPTPTTHIRLELDV